MLAKARRLRLEGDSSPKHSRLTYHVGLRGESRRGNKACCTDESTYCCVEGPTMNNDVVSKSCMVIEGDARSSRTLHLRIEAVG